jgi:hypothetical protein
MRKKLVLFAGLLLGSAAAPRTSAWDDFLRHPDANAAAVVVSQMGESTCDPSTTPSSQQVASLARLLTSRDHPTAAIRPAYLVTRCLDGGDLEDIYRAFGKLLAGHPKDFLRVLARENVPDGQLRYLVATLPLSLVDNLNGQIGELDRRAARIRSASEPGTAELSRRALTVLAARRNELATIRAQTGAR